MKKIDPASPRRRSVDFDIDDLLHPARAFAHPRHVVDDPDLTLNEKRAILASWASDAASVASKPALRELPGSYRLVTIDEVLEALSALDYRPKGPPGGKPVRTKSAARVGMAA